MIKDKTYLNDFGQIKVPKLKGKVKITLHNCRTGKNEVIEGENIITNAVRDIFANNYLGALNYPSMMPIWSKWYGGVLCYENPFTIEQGETDPDPDDYFIQGNDVNECVAHAGGTVIPEDHDDDFLRGVPTRSAFVYSDNSVKQVWEWLPSHGNSGKLISALALTHADTGDAGTGSTHWAFQNFSPFASIGNLTGASVSIDSANNIFAQYDDYHGMRYAIGEPGDYRYGNVRFDTHYLTVYISRLPYKKVGLYDKWDVIDTGRRTFTVELTQTLKCMPSFYFDPTTKYLWIFHNITGFNSDVPYWNRTVMNYAVIDCENEEIVTEGTIESDDSDLAPSCVSNQNYRDGYSSVHIFSGILKEGNYVYLPKNDGTVTNSGGRGPDIFIDGYKKINVSNQADQSAITFNSTMSRYKSPIKNGGLIICSGRVVNDGVGYSCTDQLGNSWGSFAGVYAMQNINKISTPVFPVNTGDGTVSQARYIYANKMVNTSKFNLPSPVQKTSNQAMTIEYTLTEVE